MTLKIEKVADYIIDWLICYVENSSLEGFIVGISGGVDSAVVASLCARTKKKVFLLNMPIRQRSDEYTRAQKQITLLEQQFHNVKGVEISLDDVFTSFEDKMPESTLNDKLSMANSRARLRMTTLYAIGQSNKLLVTGTGNKVEDFGIGFYTKYGDGGVDISPIGDLMKSEVYQLAKYLEVIEEIYNAVPTDGLFDESHTDEEQIGATYEELEEAMLFNGKEEKLTVRQQEVLQIYRKWHLVNRHKFAPIPVCDLSGFRAGSK